MLITTRGTDLVNYLELFQETEDDPTLTDGEMNEFLPHPHLGLGHNGLLQYGKASSRITAVEENEEAPG